MSVKHKFTSPKADGPDATLVRPTNWNDEHDVGYLMTNKSGGTVNAGDIVVLDATQGNSFITSSVTGDLRRVFVVLETIANNAVGLVSDFGNINEQVANVQGAVSAGEVLRVSPTVKRAERVAAGFTTLIPTTFGIALTSFAGPGAGTVKVFMARQPGIFNVAFEVALAATLAPPLTGYYDVIGTTFTEITGINSLPGGSLAIFRFQALAKLKHSSTLILSEGQSHYVNAGELFAFISEEPGVWRELFRSANDSTLVSEPYFHHFDDFVGQGVLMSGTVFADTTPQSLGSGAVPLTRADYHPYLRVKVAQAGGGAGTRRIGLAGAALTAAPTNGIFIEWTNAGVYTAICRSGGVQNTLPLGVNAAAGVFNTIGIYVKSSTSVRFSIDGDDIGEITTNIPTADLFLSAGNTTATPNGVNIDYWYLRSERH